MTLTQKSLFEKDWARFTILITAFFFMSFFFISPGVNYVNYQSVVKTRTFELPPPESPSEDFIRAEYDKAINEIKFRIEQQDQWYHYKFIIVGAMIAVFLGQFELFRRRRKTEFNPKDIFSTSGYAFLVLACLIVLIIDSHIRDHMSSIQMIGLWIANFVEPVYFPKTPSSGFYPWEQFIRFYNPSGSEGGDLTLNMLKKLGFSFHMHFFTMIIYAIYTVVLQQICIVFKTAKTTANTKEETSDLSVQKQVVLLGFFLVQLALIGFVIMIRAMPETHVIHLYPFPGWFANGWLAIGYYTIPLIGLMALNLPYLLFLRTRKRAKTG